MVFKPFGISEFWKTMYLFILLKMWHVNTLIQDEIVAVWFLVFQKHSVRSKTQSNSPPTIIHIKMCDKTVFNGWIFSIFPLSLWTPISILFPLCLSWGDLCLNIFWISFEVTLSFIYKLCIYIFFSSLACNDFYFYLHLEATGSFPRIFANFHK